MELNENQSALVLDATEDGEINVEVASADIHSLSGAICQAIALKLMNDPVFQEEIMAMLEEEQE
jgi:uncharacterized protein YwlG (UPF0340 family)